MKPNIERLGHSAIIIIITIGKIVCGSMCAYIRRCVRMFGLYISDGRLHFISNIVVLLLLRSFLAYLQMSSVHCVCLCRCYQVIAVVGNESTHQRLQHQNRNNDFVTNTHWTPEEDPIHSHLNTEILHWLLCWSCYVFIIRLLVRHAAISHFAMVFSCYFVAISAFFFFYYCLHIYAKKRLNRSSLGNTIWPRSALWEMGQATFVRISFIVEERTCSDFYLRIYAEYSPIHLTI